MGSGCVLLSCAPSSSKSQTLETQAAWRSSRALSAARASARSRWLRKRGATPASAEKTNGGAGARAFFAELLFFAKPGLASDAALVARACASVARRGDGRETARDSAGDARGNGAAAEATRASWRALLAADVETAEDSARATLVASRVVAFAFSALGEHAEAALGANEAWALAWAVLALTDESEALSRDASRTFEPGRGNCEKRSVSARALRRGGAAERLRAASARRPRCAATARLLEVLWTRVARRYGDEPKNTAGVGIDRRVPDADATSFAVQLLSLPRAWRRGGDPVTAWHASVAALHALTRASGRVRFPDPPESEDRRRGHGGYAAAWALGNLVEGAGVGLAAVGKVSRAERRRAATRFAESAASLLRQLPPGTTLWTRDAEAIASIASEAREAGVPEAEGGRPSDGTGVAETDDGGFVDGVAPMDSEDAAETNAVASSDFSDSDGSSLASDDEVDEVDEGARRAATRRRRRGAGSNGTGSAFPLGLRSVHPGARAQIVSALEPGFLKMLVDACLVDGAETATHGDEGDHGFAVSVDSADAGDPAAPTTRAAASEAGARAVSSFVAALAARLRSADRGALMSSLAFGTPFIARAWRVYSRFCEARRWPKEDGFFPTRGSERERFGAPNAAGVAPPFGSRLKTASGAGSSYTVTPNARWMTALGVFASAYGTFLLTGDDEEFAKRGKPLPAAETPALVATLRDALWHALWVEASDDAPPEARRDDDDDNDEDAFASRAFTTRSLARALAQVHDRNGRLGLVDPSLFHAPELFASGGGSAADGFLVEAAADLGAGASARRRDSRAGRRRGRAAELLRRGPALVPFDARVRWFAAGIARDRAESVGLRGGGAAEFLGIAPEHHVTVTRGRVFDDAMDQLGPAVFAADAAKWRVANPGVRPPGSLKGTVRVRFLNQHGVEEPGVDGGGLFKDFLGALVREAFDAKAGLFAETPDLTLYPNPASETACGADHLRRLEFLGAVLGKAVYEGILVDVPLAGFFLAKLRDGRPPELNDLATLDGETYRHLLSLKTLAPADVASLGLDFTATDQSRYASRRGDAHASVELVPGGGDVAVTAANRGRYVHLMAHHLLHRQIKKQSAAFVRGFRSLIEPETLRVFAPAELRLLISGAGGGLNVADLAACTVYSGGYFAEHPTIAMLWRILDGFSRDDQRAFLRFVTACPNTPLLGFSQLAPSFCVHRAGMGGGLEAPEASADTDRLPTAATCMNMLKLPPYASEETAREKLLLAIHSESGFDLS